MDENRENTIENEVLSTFKHIISCGHNNLSYNLTSVMVLSNLMLCRVGMEVVK